MRYDRDQAVITLAEALGRHRALTDDESQMLERSIRRMEATSRGTTMKFWTPAEDRALLKAFRVREASAVAAMLGRTVPSVCSRLNQLRKAERTKAIVRKRIRRADRQEQVGA
jgi:hypothetical protein